MNTTILEYFHFFSCCRHLFYHFSVQPWNANSSLLREVFCGKPIPFLYGKFANLLRYKIWKMVGTLLSLGTISVQNGMPFCLFSSKPPSIHYVLTKITHTCEDFESRSLKVCLTFILWHYGTLLYKKSNRQQPWSCLDSIGIWPDRNKSLAASAFLHYISSAVTI